MTYNRKIMRLELSAENPVHGGYYYAELLLPAADYEIKDAMQRTRAVGRENTVEVSILECEILPEMQDIRLDTFSLDELNFLAKRLVSLTDEELPVFYAVTDEVFRAADNDGLVSIKDLINSTYGLDTVPIASGISDPEALGRFAIENGLLSDIDDIPESAIPFLNAEQIGRVQQKNDKGVFEDGFYVPTVHYERPEVYDGVTLPEEVPETSDFAIRLLVSGTPEHIKGDPVDRAIWLMYYVENSNPAIVSRETYGAVQALIKSRQPSCKRKAKNYPLTKTLLCPDCGHTFRRQVVNGTAYWLCAAKATNKTDCAWRRVKEDEVYAAFNLMVLKYIVVCRIGSLPALMLVIGFLPEDDVFPKRHMPTSMHWRCRSRKATHGSRARFNIFLCR